MRHYSKGRLLLKHTYILANNVACALIVFASMPDEISFVNIFPSCPHEEEKNCKPRNSLQLTVISISQKVSTCRTPFVVSTLHESVLFVVILGIGNAKPEVNIKQNPIFDKKEAGQDQPDCAEALNRVTINPTVRVRVSIKTLNRIIIYHHIPLIQS